MALALHEWLPSIISDFEIRFSQEFIKPGEMWTQKLSTELSRCSLGIFCLTPENLRAPWMLFEAGAIAKGDDGRVCPVLWGMRPERLDGLPYKSFQAVSCDRSGLFKLVESLNNLLPPTRKRGDADLKKNFGLAWSKLGPALRELNKIEVPGDGATIEQILQALKTDNPDELQHEECVGYQFSSGFENHSLYRAATRIAKKRLWILGRKNRKLFDKSYQAFFLNLSSKLANGFDFRVLFLDPNSPSHILTTAHSDPDFKLKLRESIREAKTLMKRSKVPYSKCCRAYEVSRTTAALVVDDLVLHCPALLDSRGIAKGFTDSPFSVFNAASPCGKELVKAFDFLWQESAPL